MLTFTSVHDVHLRSTWLERPSILAARTEKKDFSYVAEIKTNPASIWPAILADLLPDDIRLVFEAPSVQYSQPIGQQSIRDPKVQVCSFGSGFGDWQSLDVIQRQGAVSIEPLVLGGHFAGAVLELPGWISQDRIEFPSSNEVGEVCGGGLMSHFGFQDHFETGKYWI